MTLAIDTLPRFNKLNHWVIDRYRQHEAKPDAPIGSPAVQYPTPYIAYSPDNGCEYSPKCVECPLPQCKLDTVKNNRPLTFHSNLSTPERNAAIYKARQDGVSIANLMFTFGMSRSCIFKAINRHKHYAGLAVSSAPAITAAQAILKAYDIEIFLFPKLPRGGITAIARRLGISDAATLQAFNRATRRVAVGEPV